MILGIDPGKTGAVAWMSDEGALIAVRDLPFTKEGFVPALFASWVMERDVTHAFIERASTRPKEGASRAFNYGRGYGQVEGVIAALGIPVTLVTPTKWKAAMGLSSDKTSSRTRAAQLWPGLAGTFARVKDDGRAEAALIGLYGAQSMGRMAA